MILVGQFIINGLNQRLKYSCHIPLEDGSSAVRIRSRVEREIYQDE